MLGRFPLVWIGRSKLRPPVGKQRAPEMSEGDIHFAHRPVTLATMCGPELTAAMGE